MKTKKLFLQISREKKVVLRFRVSIDALLGRGSAFIKERERERERDNGLDLVRLERRPKSIKKQRETHTDICCRSDIYCKD